MKIKEETVFEPYYDVVNVKIWVIDNGKNFCPYCGKRVERTWKYCPYCGRKLVECDIDEWDRERFKYEWKDIKYTYGWG
jgi:endogenous inhibitor of DNA gyrase (YacG/DUF329 family)